MLFGYPLNYSQYKYSRRNRPQKGHISNKGEPHYCTNIYMIYVILSTY